ncbi:MAG TPA: hypothetical protein VK914_09375 [bacterium]|jgi:hypothetical protein|nr:hypothetical protein [bacterium]
MTPELGFTLSTGLLIPDFVEQALGLDLFARGEGAQLTPLDDLKEWMRSDPWREGELFEGVGELLLGEERLARAAAEKAGAAFDLAGFELGQMEADPGYECFDPARAASILRLVVEEADALQAFNRKAHDADFALAVSFHLPDPRRHPRFSREAIARALAGHGMSAAEALAKGRAPRLELDGAFQVDLSAPGGGPVLERANGVGFLRVPCADPRVGDETVAHLSLAYPLESEGYFMLTFDALRQALSLKPGTNAS